MGVVDPLGNQVATASLWEARRRQQPLGIQVAVASLREARGWHRPLGDGNSRSAVEECWGGVWWRTVGEDCGGAVWWRGVFESERDQTTTRLPSKQLEKGMSSEL